MAKATNIRRRGKSHVVYFRRDGRQVWRSFKTKDEALRTAERIRSDRSLSTFVTAK